MIKEQLFIDNVQVPIGESINPSLTFSIADIAQPDKRKTDFSKTIKIPNSKIANKVFTHAFEINSVDNSYDVTKRVDMQYLVEGTLIMEGYVQLKSIEVLDNNDINYNVVLFGNTGNLFSSIKGKELTDLDISIFDHPLTNEAIIDSWDTQILENGILIPFALGTGYVYPLIDYGYTTDQITYDVEQLAPAIYAKEYWDRIFSEAGFTYTSTFLDSTFFKSLIVPSDPTIYAMTAQEITDRQFSVNTPNFLDTGTTTSNDIPLIGAVDEVIVFTVDVTDPSGLYDNATGEYTTVLNGSYNLNCLIDVNTTFTPFSSSLNLIATSEVRGSIRMLLNGTTVIDEVDFYIGPRAFAVGPRSTSSTPTNPDNDYRQTATTDENNIAAGRVFNPPDRYQLNAYGVNLVNGDIITIVYDADFVKFANSTSFFETSSGLFTSGGTATLTMDVGGFSNIAVNQSVGYGNTFDLNKSIPKKYKQTDFLLDIIKEYNLQVEPDKLITNNFIIEPYNDYYLNTTVRKWSEKHAVNQPYTITPTGKQKNLIYTYSHKEDKDFYNQKYITAWQENYSYREVKANNDFLKGTYKTAITRSATPIVGEPNGEIVIPRIVALDDQDQAIPTKFNHRILYYGGLKGNPVSGDLQTPWKLDWSTAVVPLNQYQYPYSGHFDDPWDATLDINFGLVNEVYYDDTLAAINVTNNNLYQAYHKRMMDNILDPNGKVFVGMFRLTASDIYTLSFRDLFHHNNAYWRLSKIINYNPTAVDLVKCEFIKVLDDRSLNIDDDIILLGDDDELELPDPLDPTDDIESRPTKNSVSFSQSDSNNYNTFTTTITGQDNYVNRTATNIEILGSGNKIYSNTSDIRLVNSDNNVIRAGVTDVTLINSDGLTIDESNVVYINGIKVNMVNENTISTKNDTIIQNYDFRPQDNYILIEDNFKEILYIVNQVDGTMIYNPLSAGLSGTFSDNRLDFEFDTNGMDANDKLIIMADVPVVSLIAEDVEDIKAEMVELNRQIGKIRS